MFPIGTPKSAILNLHQHILLSKNGMPHSDLPAEPHCPCRTVLLMWVIQAMAGAFVLEQPRSSMLLWHPRMRQFMLSIPKERFGEMTKKSNYQYDLVQ